LLLQVAEKAGDVGLGHELIKSLKKVDLSKVAKEVGAEVPSIFSVSTLREMDTLHSVQGSKARSLWRTSQKQHIREMGAAELKKRALVKEAEVIAEGVSRPKAWKNIPIDERTGIFTPTEALYYSKNPDKIPKYAFEQGGVLKWRDNIREERLGKVLDTLAFAGIAAVSSAAFALDATYHKMLEDSKKEASNKSDDELKNLSFSKFLIIPVSTILGPLNVWTATSDLKLSIFWLTSSAIFDSVLLINLQDAKTCLSFATSTRSFLTLS
jgi:hypothetical protein